MTSKQELTVLITPVGAEVQQESTALAGDGRDAKAMSRLRKASGLGLADARVALEFLTSGRRLPVDCAQALANLRSMDPELFTELSSLLVRDDTTAAIKLLRERTDVDLAGGYHLIQEMARQRG
ncbi:hypothetical protein ACL02U_13790 [Streptomyces sp. MS06]|uniref:hypothetical protein n=1 Tax=Streptomyces sp. MS06 TaxID=3385974 RepID=UPI00399FCBB0